VRAKLPFGVALIALHQGDYGAVQSPAEEALDAWRELGDRVWVSYTLYVLGLMALWTGDRTRAALVFGEAWTSLAARASRSWERSTCVDWPW
jgi:hypothetical protein